MNIRDMLLKYRQPLWEKDGEGGTPPATPPTEGGDGTPPAQDADGKPPTSLLDGASSGDDGGAEGDGDKPPVEPITLENLKFPEGVTPDEALTTTFLETINNLELSRADLAQKLIDMQIGATQAAQTTAQEAAQTAWTELQDQWQEEALKLPIIGGDALDATLATIKKGLESAGATRETFEAIALTGAGNHPAIIKLLHTLTKNLVEGGPVLGDPAHGKLSQADRMYSNSAGGQS